MRFGKSAKEAAEEPSRTGGGSDWMRYLKDGDTTFRILQEPDEWTYYWEHFNPMGFSFPCNNEEDCPGCTSEVEKMKKVTRKIAFNVLQSFNGQDYVNVYKVGSTVADKLNNRYKRFDTITDRDYTITRFKTSGDRYDFDVEGSNPTPVDLHKEEWKDIEAMLAQQWEDAWGEGSEQRPRPASASVAPTTRRATIAPAPAPQQDDEPPFEERVYQEADLRALEYDVLLKLIKDEMDMTPPAKLTTSDQVVDWLMELQS